MAFYEGPRFVLILRVIQAVLTILILGLTGYGKQLIAANLTEKKLTNTPSRQLVERLLACRRAIASQLPLVLLGHYLDHPRLPDRCTDALRGDQAQPRRYHNWSRRPDHGFLVCWLRCARSLLGRQGLLRSCLQRGESCGSLWRFRMVCNATILIYHNTCSRR